MSQNSRAKTFHTFERAQKVRRFFRAKTGLSKAMRHKGFKAMSKTSKILCKNSYNYPSREYLHKNLLIILVENQS